VNQEYAGKSSYYPDHEEGASRLLVAVLCFVEQIQVPVYALLDTASEWCVLPPKLVAELGLDLNPSEEDLPLSTRFGVLYGRLERIRVRFDAEEGEPLEVLTTCFLGADWPGPMVIGWRGCLQWMRFGFDPAGDAFYFASA
jgi:hypothetical protein